MITVGYSTRQSNPDYINYIRKTCLYKDVEVIEVINNGEKSLSEVYNKILKEAKNNIVVLCHDDLEFDTKNWGQKILTHFNNSDFGILGVAGTTEIPKSGTWWEDRRKMVGIVNHKNEGKKWESKYSKNWGDKINEVCLIDGLFICVNKERLTSNFDESIKGFHFYDVTFCVNNFLNNTKIGVIYNIRLTHLSIGETNELWEENRKEFSDKFKDILPIKSNINLDYSIKDFKFLKKYNLKIIINSDNDINKTINLLNKINSFNLPNYTINLISNENNLNDLIKLESKNIKVYEGHFDNLSKNLSILKWDDNFINDDDSLIFFIDKDVVLANNIFTSLCELYHTEKANFGCAFTASVNDDLSIYSTELNIFKNKDNQFSLMLKNSGSFYNLLDRYKNTNFGNISDVFVTTYNFLKINDWFDIKYNTNITFNDFAMKCLLKNKKCYVDTNSVIVKNSINNTDEFNNDMNNLLQTIVSEQKLQSLIQNING
jgi:hypothetical protein